MSRRKCAQKIILCKKYFDGSERLVGVPPKVRAKIFWREWAPGGIFYQTPQIWFFYRTWPKFAATEWRVNLISSWSYFLASGFLIWNTCAVFMFLPLLHYYVYRRLRGSIKRIIPPAGETSMYRSFSISCVFILQLEWVLLLWPIVNCNPLLGGTQMGGLF